MTEEPTPPMPPLDLEPAIAEFLATMYQAPLDKDDVLRRRLEVRMESVHAAAHRDDYLDIGLAERIHQALIALMAAVVDSDPTDRRLVQAAVRYFIHDEDVIADLDSPTGLDDDALATGAVARHLGLAELLPPGW